MVAATTKASAAHDASSAADTGGQLQIGDIVQIAPGTLAWSAETLLRKQIGTVISTQVDQRGELRVCVEFPRGKILAGRRADVFQLVQRPA